MDVRDPQDRPSKAEFDVLIANAQERIHRRMRVKRGPGRGWKLAAGGLAGVVIVGGGAAVANVGLFKDDPATEQLRRECRQLTGPVDIHGQPAADWCAVTTTTWETNEFGLTVGWPTRIDTQMGNWPDLIPHTYRDGLSGFARSDEIFAYLTEGPPEHPPKRTNIYGPDGKTLLGRR